MSSLESLRNIIKGSKGITFRCKESMSGTGLSQLALKEEAAGKLRVFALIDSISQSLLRPLHDACFDILRMLPNDGTFDQDASVKRSSEKVEKYGVAYSFDLSSATDRLPAKLTAAIFQDLFQIPGLADAWEALMVNREFSLTDTPADRYQVKDRTGIRYAVGQPMGGLSS